MYIFFFVFLSFEVTAAVGLRKGRLASVLQIFDPADDRSPSAETICRLVRQKIDKGNTIMHVVCVRDGEKGSAAADLASVRLFLRAEADVNATNDKHW